jgi:hypothetical protein
MTASVYILALSTAVFWFCFPLHHDYLRSQIQGTYVYCTTQLSISSVRKSIFFSYRWKVNVDNKIYWTDFTENGETCGHKTKERKKVMVDVVAMQRRRKTIVTSPLSYLIKFSICCYLHWDTVLSSNYSCNYYWEIISVFMCVKCM